MTPAIGRMELVRLLDPHGHWWESQHIKTEFSIRGHKLMNGYPAFRADVLRYIPEGVVQGNAVHHQAYPINFTVDIINMTLTARAAFNLDMVGTPKTGHVELYSFSTAFLAGHVPLSVNPDVFLNHAHALKTLKSWADGVNKDIRGKLVDLTRD